MKRSRFFWSLLAWGMVWGATVLAVRGAEPSAQQAAPAAPKQSVCSGEAPASQSQAALAEESPAGQRKAESPPSELPKPESAPSTPVVPPPATSAEPTPPAMPSAAPLSAVPPTQPQNTLPLESSEAEAALLKALAEKSTAEFVDTPLKDVIAYWRGVHKIAIVLDRKALEMGGLNEDQPITIQRKDAAFRAILEQVLETLDLTWTIRHEALWITTPEEAEHHSIPRVYDVNDLLSPRTEDLRGDLDDLIDMMTTVIRPENWEGVGGTGSIAPLIVRGRGILVIRQTWPVHLEIIQLLEDIREAVRVHASEENGRLHPFKARGSGLGLRQPPETPIDSAPSPPREKKPSFVQKVAGLFEQSSQTEAELLKILAKPAEAEFSDTPLQDVVKFLSEAHRIPIQMDRRALDAMGVSPEKSVTLHVQKGSLRSLLEQFLEPLDLTWTLRCQSIWITSRDEAEHLLVTQVYPVEDIFPAGIEEPDLSRDLEKLKDLISESIAPNSWDVKGGPGSIGVFAAGGKGVLCVRQTWPVHLDLARFLQQLPKPLSRGSESEKSSPLSRPE